MPSRDRAEHRLGHRARSVGVDVAPTCETRQLVLWLGAVVAFKYNDMAESFTLVQHFCVLIFG